MKNTTKNFMNKVRVNTYIYTFTFMVVAIGYSLKHSTGVEPFIFLLAAFAFYTLGRQIALFSDLEDGAKVDTRPRAPVWVRGLTYFIVILLVFSVMFA